MEFKIGHYYKRSYTNGEVKIFKVTRLNKHDNMIEVITLYSNYNHYLHQLLWSFSDVTIDVEIDEASALAKVL